LISDALLTLLSLFFLLLCDAVQSFAVVLADGLGLRSIASVQGFVNVDTGEMVVLDVNPFPDLTDGSCLLQQVMTPCTACKHQCWLLCDSVAFEDGQTCAQKVLHSCRCK
jgi:hypothetical protein